jgi:hypothetical protein
MMSGVSCSLIPQCIVHVYFAIPCSGWNGVVIVSRGSGGDGFNEWEDGEGIFWSGQSFER